MLPFLELDSLMTIRHNYRECQAREAVTRLPVFTLILFYFKNSSKLKILCKLIIIILVFRYLS